MGAGGVRARRDCTRLVPGKAETKVLMNLIRSDCLRPNVAIGGWGRGGIGGEKYFSLGIG